MAKSSSLVDMSSFTKKERIAFAREIAAMKREEARARRRRNRILLIAGVTVGVLVIAGLAGLALWNSYRETLAGPANMMSDGIVLTSDGTTVSAVSSARIEPGATPVATDPSTYSSTTYMVLYLDYGSKDSQALWTADAEQVESWLSSGYIALEVHPVASGSAFSRLAANAAACVADGTPDSFLAVHDALVTAGASNDTSARTADGVLGAVSNAGVTDSDVLDCVRNDRFAAWVTAASDRAATAIPNADVASAATLPTLIVDGTTYTGATDDPQGLLDFIDQLYAAAGGESDTGSSDDSDDDGSADEG
jgi:hypothetical protein